MKEILGIKNCFRDQSVVKSRFFPKKVLPLWHLHLTGR